MKFQLTTGEITAEPLYVRDQTPGDKIVIVIGTQFSSCEINFDSEQEVYFGTYSLNNQEQRVNLKKDNHVWRLEAS